MLSRPMFVSDHSIIHSVIALTDMTKIRLRQDLESPEKNPLDLEITLVYA
jgi:hypothetical protein